MKLAGTFAVIILLTVCAAAALAAEPAAKVIPWDSFEKPTFCAGCHSDLARQHEQAMMSQAFTHPWDEIEYFELAMPHAAKEPKVAGVKAGCNGCHAPLAFLSNTIPPPRPAENSRANESVSCDVCHTMTGFEGDTPFNFNFKSEPGKTKQGIREAADPPAHKIVVNPYLKSGDFCGVCHNEKDPFGIWVKSTHLEWKNGPYARGGIQCQDCHMPPAAGRAAKTGPEHADVRQHLFHGAHDPGKLSGAVEVRVHPEVRKAEPGREMKFTAVVVNAKAGHMVPSGSAEERVVWLHVEAKDSKGKTWHLKVDPKGFKGEEYTIASATAMAYQDIGDIKGIADFKGLLRDGGVPEGDRIFRLPYFDPKGRMTIAQWNTASQGTDYRLPPLEAKSETFTWKLPPEIAPGEVTVTGTVYYSRLVSSVADYMKVPAEEAVPVVMSSHETKFTVQ
jgi:nitrate/TMAO reductase-like tetraheme cytochrome c subunit